MPPLNSSSQTVYMLAAKLMYGVAVSSSTSSCAVVYRLMTNTSRLYSERFSRGLFRYPTTSPPEPFDTALALLSLSKSGDTDPVRSLIARGRAFLIAHQQDDGGWVETTRPPGGESYAQRISTTGWATPAGHRRPDA